MIVISLFIESRSHLRVLKLIKTGNVLIGQPFNSFRVRKKQEMNDFLPNAIVKHSKCILQLYVARYIDRLTASHNCWSSSSGSKLTPLRVNMTVQSAYVDGQSGVRNCSEDCDCHHYQ